MSWEVVFFPEAEADLAKLDGSQKIAVVKAIEKVRTNPLPMQEGGYGKPLGNKHGHNLSGLLKIKLRGPGIRIVYQLVRTETKMIVVVIGMRADQEVYELASKRTDKHKV
ncbi:MAG: type II toxin-antitoxin system RelE/ParE family toxin [Peptococcaceae bacterium]|nr:type II toxin-antitoxin system RelE/ParE family toxin [Peptococcaceae bacterium]